MQASRRRRVGRVPSRRSSRAADLHVAEPRGRRTVSDLHHLHRVALAAVLDAPELPLLAAGDGVTAAPEAWRDARVKRVAQHAGALAVLDLPGDFARELEVEPQV